MTPRPGTRTLRFVRGARILLLTDGGSSLDEVEAALAARGARCRVTSAAGADVPRIPWREFHATLATGEPLRLAQVVLGARGLPPGFWLHGPRWEHAGPLLARGLAPYPLALVREAPENFLPLLEAALPPTGLAGARLQGLTLHAPGADPMALTVSLAALAQRLLESGSRWVSARELAGATPDRGAERTAAVAATRRQLLRLQVRLDEVGFVLTPRVVAARLPPGAPLSKWRALLRGAEGRRGASRIGSGGRWRLEHSRVGLLAVHGASPLTERAQA